jgi:hypothetical protein
MPRRDDFDDRPRRRPRAPEGGYGLVIAVAAVGVLILGAAAAGAVWLFVDAVGPRRGVPPPPVVVAPAPPPAEDPGVGTPAVVGGVAVTVTEVYAGKLTGKATIGGGPGVTLKDLLRVAVSVENRSDRPVRFTRWTSGATMTTDRQHTLARVRFMLAERLDGELAGDVTIAPGASAADVYVFEAPPLTETSGRLTLDADRVGEAGAFRFRLHWTPVRRDPRFDPRR